MATASPSHAVFRTPELLDSIISQLGMDRNSLAQLARVSNTFHDVSIRYLWTGEVGPVPKGSYRPQDTLHRLVEIQPSLLGPQPWGDSLMRSQGESYWVRFQHYSVHSLSITLGVESYPQHLLQRLTQRREALFPRLGALTIIESMFAEYPGSEWMDLAGPPIRRLQFRGIAWWNHVNQLDNKTAFLSFAACLTRIGPQLVHLDLTNIIPPLSSNEATEFCSAIASFAQLRTFRLASQLPLSADILSHLTHPKISEITLNSIVTWPDFGDPGIRFPSLRTLSLEGDPEIIGVCIQAFANLHLLSQITLELVRPDRQNLLFHTLSLALPAAANLEVLSLIFHRLVIWFDIQLLLKCPSLSTLTVHSDAPFVGFDDNALRNLAESLPILETLSIIGADYDPQCDITLYGLIPVAKHCPRLRSLTIRVTTSVGDADTASVEKELVEHARVSTRPFGSLSLLKSEINGEGEAPDFLGPRRTAKFLSALWPSLKPSGVRVGWGETEMDRETGEEQPMEDAWTEVRDFMADLQWSRDLHLKAIEDLARENRELRETVAMMKKEQDKGGNDHIRGT